MLDAGTGPDRWSRWRPSVALCQHENLVVDRFELLFQAHFTKTRSQICDDVAAVSPETDVRCHPMKMPDPWDFEAVYGELLDFARAYPFNPEAEDYLVHITTGAHVAQICLFLLTESRYFPARLIQTIPPGKRGGPGAGSFAIIDLDLSRYDRLASRFHQEQQESTSALKGGIETRNAPFNALIEQVGQVAIASKSPVLLTGPTGAGKSQLAKRIYELKRHRRQVDGKFVEVNCATLRGDGAMSALFGHIKGAFTGAAGERPGLLRAADGGVLFLDEIAELGIDEQAMMLRAIEDKRFTPLGADADVASDFQLIAGTNADLHDAVRRGRFREDLLARINLWTFRLPPLRERGEDIEPNLNFELEQFARTHGQKVTFNKEARDAFLRFRDRARRRVGGQLPRPERGGHANGHARRNRANRHGRRRWRNPASNARLGGRGSGRSRRRTCRAARRSGAQVDRPVRSRPTRRGDQGLPTESVAVGCRPKAVRSLADEKGIVERRGPPQEITCAF